MLAIEKSLCPSLELRPCQRFSEAVCRDELAWVVAKSDVPALEMFRHGIMPNGEVIGSIRAQFALERHCDRVLFVLKDCGRFIWGKSKPSADFGGRVLHPCPD